MRFDVTFSTFAPSMRGGNNARKSRSNFHFIRVAAILNAESLELGEAIAMEHTMRHSIHSSNLL